MELFEDIRREYEFGEGTIAGVARKLGVHRRMVREAIHNEDLADLLLNRTVQKKIYETEDRIIQKSDPVLMKPGSHVGRAQFYAPYKLVGNLRIETPLFNMLVIWLMNLFLFVTLYFNLLKRLMNFMERINIPVFGSDRVTPPWELIK